MIFLSLDRIQIQILISNRVWTWDRHVAASDCTIPIRVDNERGTLDLSEIGGLRFIRTLSFKWSIGCVRSRSNGGNLKRERGRTWLGFQRDSGEVHLGGGLRRRSGDPWSTARVLRRSAEWGDLGCVSGVIDCFQYRRGSIAEAPRGVGDLRVVMLCSFYCRIEREKGVSRCAGGREGDWRQRGKLVLTVVVWIGHRSLQRWRSPSSKFVQPGGALVQLREGVQRGRRGGFIAALAWRGG
jgi:hypothetical protein